MAYRRTALSFIAAALAGGCLSAQDVAPALAERSAVATSRLMSLRRDLGLTELHTFGVKRAHQDHLGQVHTRVQQRFNGVPVWGGEAILHQDVSGADLPLTSALKANIIVNTTATLRAEDALALAHADLAPQGPYAYAPTAELVIYPVTVDVKKAGVRHKDEAELDATAMTRQVTRYVLAYHVHTELENGAEETAHTDYMINANTGEILTKWDTLRKTDAVGTGKSQFSGTVSIHTNYTGSTYELNDVYRGMNIKTYNLNHGTGSGTGTLYTDADNTWGDGTNYTGSTTSTTGATGQTAAVDAHYGIEMTYDFYKNVLGRNGIDGNNKATYSRVHYSTSYDNAFWSDTCFCMTYGDGSSFKSLESLDVAGHEMSHGVCANSANLNYSGESGGLNEANSDMFGNMVELYARNGFTLPATVSNTDRCWTVGEDLSSTPLRYMYKPSKDGSSPDQWSSSTGSLDVHYSSGPANRMFFFLSQGASATSSSDYYSSKTPSGFTGIGPEKAIKIWYRALTTYMTSSTNYAGARTAAISAVKDLYGAGGAEEAAVWNAFAAINVGSAWSGGGSDTTAPTVSVTESGTSGTITFTATASDNVGVTKVEFYVDGVLKGTDTATPWTLTLDSTTLSNGSHALVSKAYDAAGNVGTSTSVSFSVNNGTSGSSELIANGGFESGATSWTGTTAAIGTWTGQAAYEGTKNAWLCGNGKTATEYLYQTVTIPSTATSATLSFYLHIDTAETGSTAYDKLTVTVRNSSNTVLKTLATYSNVNAASGYVLRSFDLSAYKGQTVRIYFNGTEDSSLQTSFVLDKVSLAIK